MGAFHTYPSGFYEIVPCRFCGDDTRRVVCTSESCDHQVCVKERGVCWECASEKLGEFPQQAHPQTLYAHYEVSSSQDEGLGDFENAVRLLEDQG